MRQEMLFRGRRFWFAISTGALVGLLVEGLRLQQYQTDLDAREILFVPSLVGSTQAFGLACLLAAAVIGAAMVAVGIAAASLTRQVIRFDSFRRELAGRSRNRIETELVRVREEHRSENSPPRPERTSRVPAPPA